MNARGWMAGASFHNLPVKVYRCKAHKDGGWVLDSFQGHGAQERAARFRAQYESWGYTVTVTEAEVRP